jgi:hypothetical protein
MDQYLVITFINMPTHANTYYFLTVRTRGPCACLQDSRYRAVHPTFTSCFCIPAATLSPCYMLICLLPCARTVPGANSLSCSASPIRSQTQHRPCLSTPGSSRTRTPSATGAWSWSTSSQAEPGRGASASTTCSSCSMNCCPTTGPLGSCFQQPA